MLRLNSQINALKNEQVAQLYLDNRIKKVYSKTQTIKLNVTRKTCKGGFA